MVLATIALGGRAEPGRRRGGRDGRAHRGYRDCRGRRVLLSKHLSERVVSGVGGVLFLVFAALTVLGVY